MNEVQALAIIKQVIEGSLKSGLFSKMEDTVNVAIAYETISKALTPKEPAKELQPIKKAKTNEKNN